MNIAIRKSADAALNGRSIAGAASVRATGVKGLQRLLRFTFGVVPIVAGLDKFTNILVNWESYLNPQLAGMLPISAHLFMGAVGVVEVAAGILVLARPRVGALIVTIWLAAIALSLLASGRYLDVAVRDLVMAVGAYTLSQLSAISESERNAV